MAKIDKDIQKDISEKTGRLVREWEKTGKIKTSRAVYHPKNKQEAIKQALAIEYGEHHVGRAGKKRT